MRKLFVLIGFLTATVYGSAQNAFTVNSFSKNEIKTEGISKGSFYSDKTPVTAQSKFVFAIIGDFAYVKANGKLMKLKWLTGMGDDDKGADGYKSGRYTANFKYNSGNYSLEIMDNEKENAKTVADTIVFEGALYKAEAD